MTEVTDNTSNTEATATIDEAQRRAEEVGSTWLHADIIKELAEQYRMLEASKENNRVIRKRLQETLDTVETFIKNNYKDGATADELKELAEELDIELTKEITVTLKITYTAEMTVPLDFDLDKIDEGDFDISVDFRNLNDDVQFDSDDTEVDNCKVEEA